MLLVNFQELKDIASHYLSDSDLIILEKAYKFSDHAHRFQKRQSGEKYIHHPLAVTKELALLKTGINTLVAGLLHDVVEDCEYTNEDIKKEFGPDVALLVKGVTKLSNLTSAKHQKNISKINISKILLYGATDIRIFIIKLCDRLHNISTINILRPDKQFRIAKETLDYYSPIALKLSLYEIKRRLELSAFPIVYKNESKIINKRLSKISDKFKKDFTNLQNEISQELLKKGIKAQIYTRIKTGFSIYRKIYIKGRKWDRIFDIFALRVITNSPEDCYKSLGIIHSLFQIIPRRIKDFISLPKRNGYQSIHTSLNYKSYPVEVQIRTRGMDIRAQSGPASHWNYKSSLKNPKVNNKIKQYEENNQWLSDIRNYTSGSKINYFEDLTRDVDTKMLYILTPDSKVINIRYGSTVLDFAYKVHTEIGHSFDYAIVNGEKVYHNHILSNGARVKIVTKKEKSIDKSWLSYVRTPQAITQITKYIKKEGIIRTKQNIVDGKKQILNYYKLDQIKNFNFNQISKFFGFKIKNHNDLYALVGKGDLSEKDIKFLGEITKYKNFHQSKELYFRSLSIRNEDEKNHQRIIICGVCLPIPGDTIYGLSNAKNIIKAHRIECINFSKFKKTNLYWEIPQSGIHEVFKVILEIRGNYGLGFINHIVKILNKIKTNVLNIKRFKRKISNHQKIVIEIVVANKLDLDIARSNLISSPSIFSVERTIK